MIATHLSTPTLNHLSTGLQLLASYFRTTLLRSCLPWAFDSSRTSWLTPTGFPRDALLYFLVGQILTHTGLKNVHFFHYYSVKLRQAFQST